MTNDIVTRLREETDDFRIFNLVLEAADEIEQLEKTCYLLISELQQDGKYEAYTPKMLFDEFYKDALNG